MEKNLLICGDNLIALDDLIEEGIKVDLIYLGPPFFSKSSLYKGKSKGRGTNGITSKNR
jgi:DNA modification methylase